jgi:hypothetical protein
MKKMLACSEGECEGFCVVENERVLRDERDLQFAFCRAQPTHSYVEDIDRSVEARTSRRRRSEAGQPGRDFEQVRSSSFRERKKPLLIGPPSALVFHGTRRLIG